MASSIVGRLVVRLAAETATYESDMRKAQRITARRTKAMEQRVRKMQRNFERSFRIVATSAIAVTASLTAMTVRSAAAAREARDMSRTLGTTAGKLQAFGYAADQVGISSEKATDILKDLADKLGDASLNEGGELFQALESLGLSADRLQKKGPVDQLKAIGAALKGMPRAQQITVLESIGDDASRLLPLLRNNAAGLRAYSAEAREFGVAMSRVDNSKLVEADKAFKKMQGRFEGLTNQLSIAFAPAMTRALGDMGDLQKIASDPDFAKGIEAMADAMAGVAKYLAESVTQMGRLKDDIESLDLSGIASFAASRTGPGYVAQKMGWWDTGGDESTDKAKPKSLAPITVTGAPVGDDDGSTGRGTNPFTPPAPRVMDVPKRIDISSQGERDREALARITAGLKSQEERIQESYRRRTEIVDRAVEDQAKRQEMLSALNAQRLESLEHLNQDVYSNMSAYAEQAAANMQDSLADFLFDPFSDGLSGMLDGFVTTLRRMAAEMAASQIFDALTGTGGKGGGLLGTIGGTLASSFGGMRAGGGPVSSGSSYIVGEKGPEIFNPASGGNIIPNSALGGGGAGGGSGGDVVVNITNNGQPMQEEGRQKRRGPNGEHMVDIQVKSALSRMAGSGELDQVMAPFGRRSGQV